MFSLWYSYKLHFLFPSKKQRAQQQVSQHNNRKRCEDLPMKSFLLSVDIYIYIYICAVGAALSLTHDFYSVEMGLHLASPHPSRAPINFWILLPGKNKQTNIPQLQKRNPRPTNHLVFHLYPNQPENKREKNCRF